MKMLPFGCDGSQAGLLTPIQKIPGDVEVEPGEGGSQKVGELNKDMKP